MGVGSHSTVQSFAVLRNDDGAGKVGHKHSGVDAVGVAISRILNAVFHPVMFGGTCDGVAHDGDALQKANDAAIAANGVLDLTGYSFAITSGTVTLTAKIMGASAHIFNVSGTGVLRFEKTAAQEVNALWFAADPWDSFKIAAETLADHLGGTVWLAPAVYNADTTVTITSECAVNLRAEMVTSQQQGSDIALSGNYIAPSAGIGVNDALINYNGDGGGDIEGLLFVDDSDLSAPNHADRRVISFGAALKFDLWHLSTLRNCYFIYLKAKALDCVKSTMGNMQNVWIRRCGDAGKPALHLNPSIANGVQSLHITNLRSEVNYSAPYLKVESDCAAIKILDSGFEADTSEAATAQVFIDDAGDRTQVDTVHVNRTSTTKINSSGAEANYNNITANSGDTANVITSSGVDFQVTNYVGKNHVNAVDEILCTGLNPTIRGKSNTGGGVRCTNDYAEIDWTSISAQSCTNGIIEVSDRSSVKCNVRNQVASKHSVYLAGTTNRVFASHIEDFPAGTSGVYAPSGSSQNIINGNQIIAGTGATGIHTSGGSGGNNVHGNNIQGAGTATNLHGTDTTDGSNT